MGVRDTRKSRGVVTTLPFGFYTRKWTPQLSWAWSGTRRVSIAAIFQRSIAGQVCVRCFASRLPAEGSPVSVRLPLFVRAGFLLRDMSLKCEVQRHIGQLTLRRS